MPEVEMLALKAMHTVNPNTNKVERATGEQIKKVSFPPLGPMHFTATPARIFCCCSDALRNPNVLSISRNFEQLLPLIHVRIRSSSMFWRPLLVATFPR